MEVKNEPKSKKTIQKDINQNWGKELKGLTKSAYNKCLRPRETRLSILIITFVFYLQFPGTFLSQVISYNKGQV